MVSLCHRVTEFYTQVYDNTCTYHGQHHASNVWLTCWLPGRAGGDLATMPPWATGGCPGDRTVPSRITPHNGTKPTHPTGFLRLEACKRPEGSWRQVDIAFCPERTSRRKPQLVEFHPILDSPHLVQAASQLVSRMRRRLLYLRSRGDSWRASKPLHGEHHGEGARGWVPPSAATWSILGLGKNLEPYVIQTTFLPMSHIFENGSLGIGFQVQPSWEKCHIEVPHPLVFSRGYPGEWTMSP